MTLEKELKVKSPCSLAHVVLRTGNYQKMVAFYKDFLGADITFMNQNLAFLRYDEEHHRIAIIAVPGTGPKVATSAGLEHIAFTFPSLSDLVLSYQQRKAKGISPTWCVNHGPTTSIYYSDPDGNRLETQVDNFDSVKEADDFMTGKYFAENPIGTDFEPEELLRRIESGESEQSIKRRIEVGPRDVPEGF
jgi:catechol-2,3-dioxygenase